MGNSVIYRPAYDAEVEYLESDGNSYIDTGLKASSELGILAHIYLPNRAAFPFGGRNGYLNKEFSFMTRQDDNSDGFRFGSYASSNQQLALDEIYEFDNTQSHNILKVNDLIFTSTFSTFESDYNLVIFGVDNAGNAGGSSGVRIYDFKIYQNSTLIRDFIPVRIGSVGYMYDKVSKQLFANKGTGQFILGNDVSNAVIPQQRCVLYFGNQRSVGFERIYEEYEWLCGRNGAYINTNHKLHTCYDVFDCHFKWDGAINNPDGNTLGVFGCYFYKNGNIWGRASINYGKFFINYFKLVNWDVVLVNEVYEVDLKSFMSSISTEKYSYILNGTYHEFSNNGLQEMVSNADVVLFENIPDNGSYFHGDIASFRIYHDNTDFVNMTPCKLLQSIPAILDGNGIARQAGECGMWDKVSNKFYGNVASSGTFTVKGPKCYEEYKWLKTTIQRGTYLKLPLGTSMNFSFKRVWLSDFLNTWYFRTPGYVYYTDAHKLIGIWDEKNSVVVDSGDSSTINVGDTITIESTPNLLLINGKTINRYNYTSGEVSWTIATTREITSLTSSITVDGSVRYVPCKLTHGIPASVDANGIARPAGTCGMWDKVNDKFYGNVASSGSFTVSND